MTATHKNPFYFDPGFEHSVASLLHAEHYSSGAGSTPQELTRICIGSEGVGGHSAGPLLEEVINGLRRRYDRVLRSVIKTVIVVFRGETTMLKGPFENARSGVAAGEDLCVKLGWRSNAPNNETRKDGI